MAEVTQAQYNTAKQTHRKISVRINLMDFNKQTIGSIEGRVISGTLTSDANSNIRNTCDIQMVVTDASFNVGIEGKIWLDRFLQIYVGVEDVHTGEMVWTNKGIYLLNQPTYQYDAETNTLSFQGVDMMALMTDMRGGQLTEAYLIPQGSNVRDVIITILGINGFNEYVVLECANSDGAIQPVPYDINFDAGATWWDVLESLQSILPNYQMYFDVDGVFHYEPVPYKANEIVRMDDDIWKPNVISESVSYDFESVKNSIKVLGRTHSVSYFAVADPEEVKITLDIPQLTELTDGTMVGFSCDKNYGGSPYLPIVVNGVEKPVIYDNGEYVKEISAGDYWVISYSSADDAWKFLGHVQAVGEWKDDNPVSPFFIGNPAGEIKMVLYGGEYDNIMSDDLALQRAEWEIYQRCRLNDSINLTSVPIYWSEVNWMVSYTPLDSTQVAQYLIRSIQTDLTHEGTQTYNLVRWYPYYITYVPATAELLIRLYPWKFAEGAAARSIWTNIDYIMSIDSESRANKGDPSGASADVNVIGDGKFEAVGASAKSARFASDKPMLEMYADIWAKIPRFPTGILEPMTIKADVIADKSVPVVYAQKDNILVINADGNSDRAILAEVLSRSIDIDISENDATSDKSQLATVDYEPINNIDRSIATESEKKLTIVNHNISTKGGTPTSTPSQPASVDCDPVTTPSDGTAATPMSAEIDAVGVSLEFDADGTEFPSAPATTVEGAADLTWELTPDIDMSAPAQAPHDMVVFEPTGTSDVAGEATSIQPAVVYEAEATSEGSTPPTSRVQQYIQGVIEEITAEDTAMYTGGYGNALISGFANNQRELKRITINDSVTSLTTTSFPPCIYNCKKLEYVMFPASLTYIVAETGTNCGAFIADFSKCAQVPKVGLADSTYKGDVLPNSSVIRVPNSLLDEWKAADKWSNVAYKIVGV